MRIFAVDPGATTGRALANDGRVVWAGVCTLKPPRAALDFWRENAPVLTRAGRGRIVDRGNRLILQAIEVGRTTQRCWALLPRVFVDQVVGEKPLLTEFRPANSSPDIVVRGNDLIQTAVRLGIYLEACEAKRVTLVYPGQWKGQVPKNIHNQRVLAKLTPEERAVVPDDHNAIDAVGLLLWALGRK